jgi:hypothetical protein
MGALSSNAVGAAIRAFACPTWKTGLPENGCKAKDWHAAIGKTLTISAKRLAGRARTDYRKSNMPLARVATR